MPQQVTFAQRRDVPTDAYKLSMDSWDGYTASRDRILKGAQSAGVDNLMVLTGDVHVSYGFDIKRDFENPKSRTVGTEIVTTSITSGKDGSEKPANWNNLMQANPHLKFYNGRRGYAVVTLQERQARADFRTVSAVTRPGAPSPRQDRSSRRWATRASPPPDRSSRRRPPGSGRRRGHVPRRASASPRANRPAAPAGTPSHPPGPPASPRPPRTASPTGPADPAPR